MSIKISYGPGGKFTFQATDNGVSASAAEDAYSKFHKEWGEKLAAQNTVDNHSLYAYRIIEPIDKVREYVEWTQLFFREESEDFLNPTLFAEDDHYTAVAWTISPDGGPTMLRPGTPTYSGISPQRVDTGLEFNIDQLRRVGWNLQERKVKEAGNELARKRNALRYSLLDAAVSSITSHDTEVSGGKWTYLSVRNLMKSTANAFYQPKVVVLNNQRAWDMGEWIHPVDGKPLMNMGHPTGEDVLLRNGYFTSLFNLSFYLYDQVPVNEIWYADSISQDYDFIYMPLEAAVENRPLDRVAQYRWLEDRTSYVVTGERYWRQTITA